MNGLRRGDWLVPPRIRVVSGLLLLGFAAALIALAVTADGLNDFRGQPLGTDFSNMYVAGTQVLEGQPAAAYDPVRQHALAQSLFGPDTPRYGWHYPPVFLAIAALTATLPYLPALLVWLGVTLAFYLLSIALIFGRQLRASGGTAPAAPAPRDILLVALAYPAVFDNLGHGQNGFLTAALLGLGLLALQERPFAAGVLFGLLCYKPQFGLLIPVALVAGGHWRSVTAAALTVVILVGTAWLTLGSATWQAFLASLPFTREVLEQGGPGWHKIQSVFAWVRMWGGGIPLAYAVQGTVTLVIAVALAWLWRNAAAFPQKAAALAIGVVIATPYSLDYDMMAIAPAIAFLVVDGCRRGFLPWDKTAVAALWLAPLVGRSLAASTLIPVAVVTMLVVFGLVLRRARHDLGLTRRSRLPAT